MEIETPADKVISLFGGPQRLATLLGKSRWAIHRWRLPKAKGGADGEVPPRLHKELLEIASREGVALAPSDLMPWLGSHADTAA